MSKIGDPISIRKPPRFGYLTPVAINQEALLVLARNMPLREHIQRAYDEVNAMGKCLAEYTVEELRAMAPDEYRRRYEAEYSSVSAIIARQRQTAAEPILRDARPGGITEKQIEPVVIRPIIQPLERAILTVQVTE